jgi:hypothetical protein
LGGSSESSKANSGTPEFDAEENREDAEDAEDRVKRGTTTTAKADEGRGLKVEQVAGT